MLAVVRWLGMLLKVYDAVNRVLLIFVVWKKDPMRWKRALRNARGVPPAQSLQPLYASIVRGK